MGQTKQTIKQFIVIATIIGVVCLPMLIVNIAQAAPTYKSTNYGVDEVFMGAGGLNDASSASYRARASLGDLTVGNTSSTNYQAYGGFTTNTDPYIEFAVNGIDVDLGELSTTSAKMTSATFTIRTYLASGYEVVNASDPPANIGSRTHFLDALTSPTAYSQGVEQFGINLVANTSPESIGAIPIQIPDATYSFGQADDDYDNQNLYKYVKGDRVAFSDKSSGTTQYTVSYMFSRSDITPAGTYVFGHVLVATSTY